MGPNRNPKWSTSGMGVTLSYLSTPVSINSPQRHIMYGYRNQTCFEKYITLIKGLSVIINIIPSIKCPRGFNFREKIS